MTENRKEFFCTKELHGLHPELNVREDSRDGRDYVVFSNPGRIVHNVAPEWPVGIELWIGHYHERNVDGKIYDPLRFYPDQRGLTEDLTGTVYGEIGTMAEVFTQHIYGGYIIQVIFGEYVKLSDSQRYFLVDSPYDVELAMKDDPATTKHVMVRIMKDLRECAINNTIGELCNFMYHGIQHAADGFRRYDFLVYPLRDGLHSSRAQAITARNYVHFYAAMYDSVIMLAHHNQARQSRQK